MTGDEMDAVFQALSHGDRRRILDIVKERPGCIVNDLLPFFESSRIAVLKHLRVLEAAGLVIGQKEGRRLRLYLNAAPIQLIHDRWTTEFSSYWASAMTRVKFAVEGVQPPQSKESGNAGN